VRNTLRADHLVIELIEPSIKRCKMHRRRLGVAEVSVKRFEDRGELSSWLPVFVTVRRNAA
jgi:hypothetical protein